MNEMKEINEDESILLQHLAIPSFLAELFNADFLNSEYFKNLHYENEIHKDILRRSGLGNPACMQIMLYSLLVVPQELLSKPQFKSFENYQLKHLNPKIPTYIEDGTYSTYENEDTCEKINYVRHIRNSIAHANMHYFERNGIPHVKFIDSSLDKKSKCEIVMQCRYVGSILMDLQKNTMNLLDSMLFSK